MEIRSSYSAQKNTLLRFKKNKQKSIIYKHPVNFGKSCNFSLSPIKSLFKRIKLLFKQKTKNTFYPDGKIKEVFENGTKTKYSYDGKIILKENSSERLELKYSGNDIVSQNYQKKNKIFGKPDKHELLDAYLSTLNKEPKQI